MVVVCESVTLMFVGGALKLAHQKHHYIKRLDQLFETLFYYLLPP